MKKITFRNKVVASDEKGTITTTDGDKYYPTDVEREFYISTSKKPIDLTDVTEKLFRAMFEETIKIYKKYGVELRDMEKVFIYQNAVLENMKQRVFADAILNVEPENFIPGVNYEGKMSIDRLVKYNDKIERKQSKNNTK